MVGQKSSATSSSPSASVDLPSIPIDAKQVLGMRLPPTSSEPEAEGDRQRTSLLRVLRAGADVALRSSIYPGSVPTGKVPINEIRKTPPFTLTTVPGEYQAVMPWPGVVFPESSRPPRPA